MIDGTGNVADARLVRSVGKGLDESASDILRTWKFKPALKKVRLGDRRAVGRVLSTGYGTRAGAGVRAGPQGPLVTFCGTYVPSTDILRHGAG